MSTINEQNLFLCGMFRSGTTLLTKVLGAYPQIGTVTSPYMYFFKALKNEIYSQLGCDTSEDEPISGNHGWFNREYYNYLAKTDLMIPLSIEWREYIIENSTMN